MKQNGAYYFLKFNFTHKSMKLNSLIMLSL